MNAFYNPKPNWTTPFRGLSVLVEEEPLIRMLWTERFQQCDARLEVYENPLCFLADIARYTGCEEDVTFYFDQYFGAVRGVGTELARAVAGLNKSQNVCLVTGYDPSDFRRELRDGLLQVVFDKYPIDIFEDED